MLKQVLVLLSIILLNIIPNYVLGQQIGTLTAPLTPSNCADLQRAVYPGLNNNEYGCISVADLNSKMGSYCDGLVDESTGFVCALNRNDFINHQLTEADGFTELILNGAGGEVCRSGFQSLFCGYTFPKCSGNGNSNALPLCLSGCENAHLNCGLPKGDLNRVCSGFTSNTETGPSDTCTGSGSTVSPARFLLFSSVVASFLLILF